MMNVLPASTISRIHDAQTAAAARETAAQVGADFESIFLHMMLEPLEEVGESFFGGGTGGRIFGGLYRQQIADAMAQSRPLGIADLIESTLSDALDSRSLDEVQSATAMTPSLQSTIDHARGFETYGREQR
ncbi:MAG: rod-binding protein [Planctomycetes bacterium]|nr:rod-binding protein [Planctomycetota bacterium]